MKVFQIEATNFCNASCSYCPHSKMTREKGFMSVETFLQVLDVMDNAYTGLHHFGEPMLNPNLSTFIELAKTRGILTEFSTNGSCFHTIVQVMAARPYIIRYAYDAFKDLRFLKELTTHNKGTIIKTHSIEEGTKPFANFAGAVAGESIAKGECYFKKYGYVVVLWDGRVVPCCCDYNGQHIIGTVWDGIEMRKNYSLCEKCEGYQFPSDSLYEECFWKGWQKL